MSKNLTLVIKNFKTTTNGNATLATLQRHAQIESIAEKTFNQLLFSLFGLDENIALAIAPIRALADGLMVNDSWWLCADPVQLQADMANIYMLGTEHLELTSAETNALRVEINNLLHAYNLELITPTPSRWYLRLQQDPQVNFFALDSIIGKNIHSYLPQGESARYWQMLLTEIQMQLHNSSVNRQRTILNKPLINSVWFWGKGQLPNIDNKSIWQMVWSNDAVVNGLAQLTKTKINPLMNNGIEQIQQQKEGHFLMVIADQFMPLREIMDIWINPVLTALRNNQLQSLALYIDNVRYLVYSKQLRSWWQKLFRN